MPNLKDIIKSCLIDIALFCEYSSQLTLRSYQVEVARAVLDSIIKRKGLSIVVMFPRQSGKNELQAHIETFLLTLLQNRKSVV